MVKIKTDKTQVIAWDNKNGEEFEVESKKINARGIFTNNYTKKIFKKILRHLENTKNEDRLEFYIYGDRKDKAKVLMVKDLDTGRFFAMSGLTIKGNYNLVGYKDICDKNIRVK